MVPFDAPKLDALLTASGIDVLIVSSRHNVRYLAGSYSGFFARQDAIGDDRYQPLVVYVPGRPETAFMVGSELDRSQHEREHIWLETIDSTFRTSEAIEAACERIQALGLDRSTFGIEPSFLPMSAGSALSASFPRAELADATFVLEEVRAVKTDAEIELIRTVSEKIIDAMATVMTSSPPDATTQELANALQVEEARRGVDFEYCLAATGTSFNRAPGTDPWKAGAILSLDSGGTLDGYIGDVCRMAVRGEPTALMVEALGEIRSVQAAAIAAIRPGASGTEIYARATETLAELPHGATGAVAVHGLGLVAHEAPRLLDPSPVHAPATHAQRGLEAGMVLSVECDLRIKNLGLVKLEDTVVVTEQGAEMCGGQHRDWLVLDY
jgi:Xaa-Pro aminopeptidase